MNRKLKSLSIIMLLSWILFSSTDIHAQYIQKIPVWRARLIAQDLIRFDSVMAENTKLMKDNLDLALKADTRLRMIQTLDQIVSEKDNQIELTTQKFNTAMQWEPIAIKYKRQRNLIGGSLGGATLVLIAGIVYKSIRK